ncbi:hypothetical protein Tco_1474265 [Tanacetum coccineum]
MMSDHNSSDLAPQRQEMSVENVTSGLVPQGQKASDYDNSDPVPQDNSCSLQQRKTDSSQQWKNKKDEDHTVIPPTKHNCKLKIYAQEEGIDFEESFAPVARFEAEEVLNVAQQELFVDPIIPEKIHLLRKLCYGLKSSSKSPVIKHDQQKDLKRLKESLNTKGTINIGLWYLKDSGFELTAFSDADHVGCIDTRKSTSRGIQFLGDKIVVRLGINPMIQPEPEDLPKDNPKLEIAVLRSNGGNGNLNPIQMLNLRRHTILKAQDLKTKTSANSDLKLSR